MAVIIEKNCLQNVSKFIKLAVDQVKQLETDLDLVTKREKVAQTLLTYKNKNFEKSLIKAAEALYNSDFFSEEEEKNIFVKKAKEDPAYLSGVLCKVCEAADVSLIGQPARVAARSKKQGDYDPVEARAFGYGRLGGNILLDD